MQNSIIKSQSEKSSYKPHTHTHTQWLQAKASNHLDKQTNRAEQQLNNIQIPELRLKHPPHTPTTPPQKPWRNFSRSTETTQDRKEAVGARGKDEGAEY
jgi:hypothetical protein